ncbi:MAG: hypothetical protein Q7U64_03115 [Desulfocapsaceae bacterium]|jgi:hypothetical protein|nr:hypothetical protein [Desulfocapsaceae bacterium]
MSARIKYTNEPIEAKIIQYFTQYQRMIRKLIDSYVDVYDKP